MPLIPDGCVDGVLLARRLLMATGMSHRASSTLAAVLLLAATATVAQADDQQAPVVVVSPQPPVIVTTGTGAGPATTAAPTAPATGAPQNEDWQDLSHINGQLVKVGEKNEYRKSYKRTIISTNPLGWVLGSYGVSVSYGLNQNIAIRGDVNYISNYVDEDTTGAELGVGLPIYFRRTYQGLFLEPGFISRRFTTASEDTVNTAGPQVLVGWHWTWDSGLNFALAAGMGRNWSGDDEYDKVFGNGYMRFGYAF